MQIVHRKHRIGARPVLGRAVACAIVTLTIAAGSAPMRAGRTSAVTHWNAVASDAFAPKEGTDPLAQTRTFAILHAAVHDVLNAIDPRYELYTPGLAAEPGASVDAAVATAARDVLVKLIPGQEGAVEAAYAEAMAAIAEGAAKRAGITAGRQSALATMLARQDDGADRATNPVYVPTREPGDYAFTPPFDFAFYPGWRRVTPFAIDPERHWLLGPATLSTAAYAMDFKRVKAVGSAKSTTRTAEQSEIARFWYEDSPLGWNRIARTVIDRQDVDPRDAARILALVNFAMADGFIAGFEAKYAFRFWRPITAIREADSDGNPFTTADRSWEPFLPTPPVPDYPSTHTVLGAAAAEVLIRSFGDGVPFSATSLTLPGVTRHFNGFSEAARENGRSRVYAGIHFERAVEHGYRQGRGIGRAVSKALPPLD